MTLSRRGFLLSTAAVAGTGLLAGCATGGSPSSVGGLLLPPQTALIPRPGQRIVTKTLTAARARIDLGGPVVDTWAYNETVPGPLIRATAGDLVRIRLENHLPAQTTTHWHGIALRNSADGVPGLTQKAVESGGSFQYDFVPSDPGTYFYHPHVGVQLDRGLYAPLLIDDPSETGDYDVEWVVVLDDWIDGTGTTPDEVLANLIRASSSSGSMDGMNMSGMAGMSMGASDPVFGDAGDVKYPYYLVNGRVSSAPNVLRAKPGQRVRIRLINAAADTIFAVALGEHKMSLTHTDGFRVTPTSTDALYIGMGERYDAVVTVKDGVFPLIAKPVGKTGQAMALIRTGGGQAPAAGVNLPAFSRTILLGSDLTPDDTARLPRRAADQTIDLVLGGQMSPYSWAINGAPYPKNKPITITKGNRVTVRLRNRTMMTHPLHIHGHTFALPNGLRKDTVLLKPMQKMDVELQANNPGNWMAHCHNIYHGEAGMMAALVYR